MLFKEISAVIFVLAIVFNCGNIVVLAASSEDLAITNEVKTRLETDKDILGNIDVLTKDGVVNLVGKVDTSLQAHRAIEIASSVNNVVDVVDAGLKVKGSKSIMTDAVITAKVKGKIRHLYINNKIANGYDLHVETTDQVVYILGNVAQEADIDTITAAAKGVKGVKSVKMSVNYPSKK